MKSNFYSTLLIQDDRAQCLRGLHSGWFSLLQNLQACFSPQSPQVNNKTYLKFSLGKIGHVSQGCNCPIPKAHGPV